VVTGSTRGIGREIVKLFASNGANVAFCSSRADNVENLKQEITQTYPNADIIAAVADMSKKNEVLDFANIVSAKWDAVDILVNNAGVFKPGKLIDEAEGTLEETINTNLYSAYYLTRALLPAIRKSNKGYIFNMTSVAATKAYPNGGSYAISKHALLGFSRGIREELKEENIAVCSLIPGATLTDSWAGVDMPVSRFIEAADIAKIVWDVYALSTRAVVEDIVIRPMLGDI